MNACKMAHVNERNRVGHIHFTKVIDNYYILL
uniref:Uncharacterized protein n=1 Tax=Anguilla anguilla TaxID=7936 RepID=A0A0E9XU11_ANGAN